MLEVQISQLTTPLKSRYKTDLLKHRINQPPPTQTPFQQCTFKQIPIKEYSNKFLRESASKQNHKERSHNSRLTSIINKHKTFQKKYHKVLNKKHYVCKTEPNQHQYKCFTTSKNFYQLHQAEIVRIKTENMIHKNFPSELEHMDQEQIRNLHEGPLQQVETKTKIRFECLSSNKKQEKISTSRALELFSRIITKDKTDLLDRIKTCNQKKMLKDKLMESSKNLQARQMILMEKEKKYSFIEKGQKKLSIKTSLKYRHKKRSQVHQLFRDDENFSITGWDNPY